MFKNKKRYLLISHELTNTGAPRALLMLAKTLKELGCFVIVLSYSGGTLLEDFKKNNIPVFILSIKKIKLISPLFWVFNNIICNTISCYKTVNTLQKSGINVTWWIHEAGLLTDYIKSIKNKDLLINALKTNKNLYCVSEYSKSFVKEYNKNIKILSLSIDDEYAIYKQSKKNDITKIAYFGEVIPLKGQDIFLDYFLALPDEIKEKYSINFIGRLCDEKFYNELISKIKDHKNIKFLGNLSHNQAMTELAKSDLFALFSRGDSFSIATAEALMLNKPVIISPEVGISNIINQENCGFIVKSQEDFEAIFSNFSATNINSPREAFLKHFSNNSYKKLISEVFLI